jgi:PAS domain S-box-containing protein
VEGRLITSMNEQASPQSAARAWLQRLKPWAILAAAIGLAALVRLPLDGYWSGQFPFMTYFPAILVVTMLCGWRYGALAAVIAAAIIYFVHRVPGSGLFVLSSIAIFLLANAVMIALAESTRRARARAEAEATSARESEERFTVMADSVPLMIWVHDARGNLLFVNRRWEEFFGITQESARRTGWQAALHDEDRPAYSGRFLEAVRRKTAFHATARVRRADGEWRWVESYGVPRFGLDGELLTFAGTSHDVTERHAFETEREMLLESERAARTDAENATRAKDEFLATLSHELRTPLSVIVLWSRILARKYGAGEEDLRKGLALIIDNGMALSKLIGDLLDMSRIVSGRVSLDARPLDVVELLGQAVASHRPAADARHLDLSLDIDSEPLIVLGDPTRLQQVLWNLLANAVKFAKEDGHIRVAVRRSGRNVEISVTDDGEGIAPEFLSQVFSRFRQADNSTARRHGGLGLGLSIVKQLVELHGGQVEALSDGVGQGATFVVTLPMQEPTMQHDPNSSGTWRRLDPDRTLTQRLDGKRVLAVEDQPDMLESLRHMLEEQGARVTGVGSGAAALDLLRSRAGDFDVLVSDIGMPHMDGYELIRRVRGELGLSAQRLAAIAITAYARDEDRSRALLAGYQAHLVKPYHVGQLVALVGDLHGVSSYATAAAPASARTSIAI